MPRSVVGDVDVGDRKTQQSRSVHLPARERDHRRNFGGDPWKKVQVGPIVIAISTKANQRVPRQRNPIKTSACRKH